MTGQAFTRLCSRRDVGQKVSQRVFRTSTRLALLLAILLPLTPAVAGDTAGGLPLPRFVSLKAARVNLRLGPGNDYQVAWIYTKPGLPVEILQEFDTWRRIRDADGTVGWVAVSLLAGKRTALVAPWEKAGTTVPARSKPSKDAAVSAYLQPGVQTAIKTCRDGWCRLSDTRFDGWIEEERLWGVYPDEKVD